MRTTTCKTNEKENRNGYVAAEAASTVPEKRKVVEALRPVERDKGQSGGARGRPHRRPRSERLHSKQTRRLSHKLIRLLTF